MSVSEELKFYDLGKCSLSFTRNALFLRTLCVIRNSNWASMFICHREQRTISQTLIPKFYV